MPTSSPHALPGNAGFAFVGERLAPAASLPPRMAERVLGMRNPHGKPNADVMRQIATAPDPRRPGLLWQIDFPAELNEHEAALYEYPFHHLYRTVRPKRARWWVNPQADPRLRTALARRERYLATPIGDKLPAFQWHQATHIPDDSLLVVARDDDFTHGLLAARPFALWWDRFHSRRTPMFAFESFPFTWPLSTGLNALSATQEELRHAVARAARSGNAEQLSGAVTLAYGWPAELDEGEMLARLVELNGQRCA